MRMDVDTGGYSSATDSFYSSNQGVIDAVTTLSGAAAAPLLEAGCDAGAALAQLANLSNASLSNHDAADYGSRIYGPPMAGSSGGDSDPDHYTESVSAPAPPSAYGGTGDQPGWWHWIAGHVGGLLWPDADTGQLNAAGEAWKRAGSTVTAYASSVDSAGSQIGLQKSPEVPAAVATCAAMSGHLTDLGAA